jgi:hypothetical protein
MWFLSLNQSEGIWRVWGFEYWIPPRIDFMYFITRRDWIRSLCKVCSLRSCRYQLRLLVISGMEANRQRGFWRWVELLRLTSISPISRARYKMIHFSCWSLILWYDMKWWWEKVLLHGMSEWVARLRIPAGTKQQTSKAAAAAGAGVSVNVRQTVSSCIIVTLRCHLPLPCPEQHRQTFVILKATYFIAYTSLIYEITKMFKKLISIEMSHAHACTSKNNNIYIFPFRLELESTFVYCQVNWSVSEARFGI